MSHNKTHICNIFITTHSLTFFVARYTSFRARGDYGELQCFIRDTIIRLQYQQYADDMRPLVSRRPTGD